VANEHILTTQIANIVEETWAPTFAIEANEELMVAKHFKGDWIAGKFANQLNISKVAVATAQVLTTGNGAAASLVYEQDTESNITVDPRSIYCGFQINRNAQTRFLREAGYRAAKKKQIMAALKVDIDQQAAALVPSLSTNVVGSGAVDVSKTLLLSGLGKLIAGAKEFYVWGETKAYLCVYSLQADDLLAIPEITAADIRGDSQNPNVKGRVWTAWNLEVSESGNISTSGGAAHNLLHIPQSHALAYNEEPTFLAPQNSGLALIQLCYTEYGVGEVWDEYAVDVQTKTT
jgi:hypothetical protein